MGTVAKSVRREPEPGERELTPDEIFAVLTNSRRRYVLYFLDRSNPRELGELAEHIAALEHDTTPDALSSAQRKSVYTSLYQTHLPKLADLGIIEYDQSRGTIRLMDRADQLEPYLDPERGAENRWSSYYLGLALLSGGFLLASELLPSPLLSLSALAEVLVILLMFVGLTAAYSRARTR